MTDTDIPLLMDYLNGYWDAQKEARLQQRIASGALDPQELQAMQQIYAQTGQLPEPVPSGRLRQNFYAMLSTTDRQPAVSLWQRSLQWLHQNPSVRLSQVAAALALLLLGIAAGYWLKPTHGYETQIAGLTSEVQQMRQAMVLTLLDQPSATQRLKAVSISTDLSRADEKIYQALLRTLNEDTQVNVRLAALEALLRYGQEPRVRQGLVQSIPQQDSPLVQIALAEAMVALQEAQAVAPLKTLLKKEDLNDTAKQAIEQSLQILI